MEALVHNLNTMHSRAGAQVPFSSINYGTDTTPEGRMVIRNILLARGRRSGQWRDSHLPDPYLQGQGRHQLQRGRSELRSVQAGLSRYRPSGCSRTSPSWTPLSTCSTTSPAITTPKWPTWAAGPVSWPMSTIRTREVTCGRGNLSFTSINLPRIAINAHGNVEWFFEELERKDGSGHRASCWSASRSRLPRRCATIPS